MTKEQALEIIRTKKLPMSHQELAQYKLALKILSNFTATN
jgi:hypothetical protein